MNLPRFKITKLANDIIILQNRAIPMLISKPINPKYSFPFK